MSHPPDIPLLVATTPRHQRIIDVHILLLDDDGNVLLALRQNTGYADGLWNAPSGHLEAGEHTAAGATREAGEEIGVIIEPADMTFALAIDHRGSPAEAPRLGMFFAATQWSGTPINAEPSKCGGIAWYPLTSPPANTVAYHAAAMGHIVAGRRHAVHGWVNE